RRIVVPHARAYPADRGQGAEEALSPERVPEAEGVPRLSASLGGGLRQSNGRMGRTVANAPRHISSSVCSPSLISTGASCRCSASARCTRGLFIVLSYEHVKRSRSPGPSSGRSSYAD